ncbi:MAG: secondary thiamine-phosphate synthase enzyme YjbQ [Thermovirgaceae bacterium]
MHKTLKISTKSRSQMVDITREIALAVSESGVRLGVCRIFVPHTTAAVTVNESADPDVAADILMSLEKLVPWGDNYGHAEGNSAAHIKATLVGPDLALLVEEGKFLLGTWQGIFLCEFDGPRTRNVFVRVDEA